METIPIPPPDDPTPLPGDLSSDLVPLTRPDDSPLGWREWACQQVVGLNWRGFLFVVFWGVFLQSNWRGCDSAQRLRRIEDQQREFNQQLIELRQSLPRPRHADR